MQTQYECYAGDENMRWCDATRQAADEGQRKRDGVSSEVLHTFFHILRCRMFSR